MYLHQLPDWTDFKWDERSVLIRLGELRYKQGLVLGRMSGLGFELDKEALLETLSLEVQKSAEIEGEIFEREQVRSSLANHLGLEWGGTVSTDRHIDGMVEMLLDATQNFAQPLTEERLFAWHRLLFPLVKGRYRMVVGDWRKDVSGRMRVVSGTIGKETIHFEAPEAALVPEEMAHFLDWFNREEGQNLLLKAAIAHLWFVTIHPFEDGNGRIARALTEMLLARSDNQSTRFYSLSAQIRSERKSYYEHLEHTQKGTGDITNWLQWFLDCLDKALADSASLLSKVLNKVRFWQSHGITPFNDRQRKLIALLLDGFEGKLTSSKYAKICKCSQDTALRDLQDLIQKGILQQSESGSRSTNYEWVARE